MNPCHYALFGVEGRHGSCGTMIMLPVYHAQHGLLFAYEKHWLQMQSDGIGLFQSSCFSIFKIHYNKMDIICNTSPLKPEKMNMK